MIENQDGTYIYLVVPKKFNCVYQNLLIRLAELGIDILTDCTATCRGVNKHIVNCWNMFQAACAAYALGEEKKANLLINYITGQLQFSCDLFDTGDKDPEPTPEPTPAKTPELKDFSIEGFKDGVGELNLEVSKINLTLVDIDKVVDDKLYIVDRSNGGTLCVITEIKNNPSTGEFKLTVPVGTTKKLQVLGKAITENNETVAVMSNIISATRSIPKVSTYYYYGTSVVTESTISNGTKVTNKNINNVNVPSKVFWIAIPSNNKLVIDNADMKGDYYYNPDAGYNNNRLVKSDVTVDNKSYTLYTFTYFVNQNKNLNITIS